MSGSTSTPPSTPPPDAAEGRRIGPLALGLSALGVVVVLAALLLVGVESEWVEAPGSDPATQAAAEREGEAATRAEADSAPPLRVPRTSLAWPLPPRATLELTFADLAAPGEALVVHLALPVPSLDDAPRPVRLVSQPDHRILELEGRVSSDRGVATIEVDPAYLRTGSYLVEVRTTEQTHFPLRRYFIVVR